jgi:hypothetical protein
VIRAGRFAAAVTADGYVIRDVVHDTVVARVYCGGSIGDRRRAAVAECNQRSATLISEISRLAPRG